MTGKSIFNSSEVAIERIMNVNTNAHFWMIREFVPDMMERNSGSVVAVSSMAGMVGTANLNDYCASKYAVVGLMESLEGELYNEGKRGVHCTVVCPYYIDTGMFAGVNPGLLPLLTPRYVVDKVRVFSFLNARSCTASSMRSTLSHAPDGWRGRFMISCCECHFVS